MEEISRYSRHLLLPEIGAAGQEKLKKAKVLVVGAGGLGCPVLLYLAAAGVGEIGIVDFDTIEESNLQRQVLYSVADIGEAKAKVAAAKLLKQNPFVKYTFYNLRISNQNALEIIKNYDVIIDGTDNFSSRYLINDACVLLDKPLIYGSIFRFEGQVSVFNGINKKGVKGPTYRCLFPVPPTPESSPNCSTVGVLGVLPGIIGTMQANETIKLITGAGEILSGKLLLINALTMDFNIIEISRTSELIEIMPKDAEELRKRDYEVFCGTHQQNNVKKITKKELVLLLKKKEMVQIIDVREQGEQPFIEELVDLQIPLGNILGNVEKISKEKQVVMFCKSGQRSKQAIQLLQKDFSFINLYNLDGGILEWLKSIH